MLHTLHKHLGFFLLAGAMGALVLLTSCTTVVRYQCPRLAPPTPSIVDALESTGRKDPASGAWVIGLENHYEKLEVCNK